MENNHNFSPDNSLNLESKDKKKFTLSDVKIAAFEGKINKNYVPEIEEYANDKVGFGMWDFRVKYPKDSEIPPITYFHGIYRNGFIELLNFHGFYKRYRSDGSYFLLHCENNIIEEVESINIADFIIQYLDNQIEGIVFIHTISRYTLKFEASLPLLKETIKKQCHSIFNKSFLELLPTLTNEILKDNPNECYKLFRNHICKITISGVEFLEYKELNEKCVWKNQLIDIDFTITTYFQESNFYKFIRNISNAEKEPDRYLAFVTAIGYMLHNYNAPEKGQAIICYDEDITDVSRPQGGTGKGLFGKGIGKLSEQVKIDGKKFDENNRFCFQSIRDSTQSVLFDDVKTKLGFDRFNSILTDGWTIERKNRDEFEIRPEDSPKVLITSNTILESEGSTRKRRQFILEFSNFYSKKIIKGNEEPIKEFHNCIFFSKDWDNKEWQMFYSFMIACIHEFLQKGLFYYEPKNVKKNRLKQITNDDFAEWVISQDFKLNKVYEIKPLYVVFKETYSPDEDFSQRKLTNYLKKYAAIYDLFFKQPPANNGHTYFELIK